MSRFVPILDHEEVQEKMAQCTSPRVILPPGDQIREYYHIHCVECLN
jgi:hypothetical protein